jgi:hypothetical protein
MKYCVYYNCLVVAIYKSLKSALNYIAKKGFKN